MEFYKRIRQLREKKGASQQDIADAMGIARATYASLENQRRQPYLGEILSIAKYHQIPPVDLLPSQAGCTSVVNESAATYRRDIKKSEIANRDLDPQLNLDKLRESLIYIAEKIGARSNFGEAVLYRLLYFIDFDYYEKTGQSITGLTYIRNHYGPVPNSRQFLDVVGKMIKGRELEVVETKHFKNTQKKYLPLRSVSFNELSASELWHIDEVLNRLGNKTTDQLSDLSRKDMPWLMAEDDKPIDYGDVFYRNNL